MKRRELLTGLAAAVIAGGCCSSSKAPSSVRQSQARYTKQIALLTSGYAA
jgi:hypothetical protein